jgi:hypothetical protein
MIDKFIIKTNEKFKNDFFNLFMSSYISDVPLNSYPIIHSSNNPFIRHPAG